MGSREISEGAQSIVSNLGAERSYPIAVTKVDYFNYMHLAKVANFPLLDDNTLAIPPRGTQERHALDEVNSHVEAFVYILRLPKNASDLNQTRMQNFAAQEVEQVFGHTGGFSPAQRLRLAYEYPQLIQAYSQYKEIKPEDNLRYSNQATQFEIETMGRFPLFENPTPDAIVHIPRWTAMLVSHTSKDAALDPYREDLEESIEKRLTRAPTQRRLSGLSAIPSSEEMGEAIFQEFRNTVFRVMTRLLAQNFRPTQLPLLIQRYPELMKAYVAYADTHQ